VFGKGELGILVVAEAPGAEDDDAGTPFVGKAGRYLRRCLSDLGVNLDRDCWQTNSLICRPPDNRAPTEDEIDYCRPNLRKVIDTLQPRHILTFGRAACVSVLAPYWKDGQFGPLLRWVGWPIPLQAGNCWVTPNFHPNYVLQCADESDGPLVELWFKRYLARHIALQGRPWETVPNYEKQVRIVMDPEQAARWIYQKLETDGAFSFDYETDRLKPDAADAEVVTCSICWEGKETIAFPWCGAAIPAVGDFTSSQHFKIGANNAFEDRWTMKYFGHPVENFRWDVVLKAHHLDNREGITSVKFQALVTLGQPDWSYTLEPYLDGVGGNGRNKIRDADLRSLLLYNGMDSVIQYGIALKQRGRRCVSEV
jgi:uracil-DNA glycosylase family 4